MTLIRIPVLYSPWSLVLIGSSLIYRMGVVMDKSISRCKKSPDKHRVLPLRFYVRKIIPFVYGFSDRLNKGICKSILRKVDVAMILAIALYK